MFSNRTLLELTRIADVLTHSEIDRIVVVFNFTPTFSNNKTGKTTDIYRNLVYNSGKGPFTDNIQLDFLQYLIDEYFIRNPNYEKGGSAYNGLSKTKNFENAFSLTCKELTNSLKRDGYIVEGKTIKKLLPQEIQEAKTESELMINLDAFDFKQSKGHLTQAILNHCQGNWASANAQFRPFIESLLIEISRRLTPKNEAKTFAQAVKLLSESVSPSFFSLALNEIPKDKDSDSFVYGLWVRLHPDGSHPGLSDEDDCSFRYQITIVFANYLLRRLTERNKVNS